MGAARGILAKGRGTGARLPPLAGPAAGPMRLFAATGAASLYVRNTRTSTGRRGSGRTAAAELLRGMNCSADFGTVLAVASLCIMFAVLLLQGFGAGGFYIDDATLVVLVASMSALAVLGVLGGPCRGIVAHGSG